jgi:hypothetical protein
MASGEIRTSKAHAIGAHIRRIGIDHHSAAEISTTQITSRKISIAELRALQISTIKTGATEISPLQVGFTQIGIAEIGIAKVSTDQVGTLQTRRAQITAGTGTAVEQSLPGSAMRLHDH